MAGNSSRDTIDLREIARTLWNNKKSFYKIWIWTFILSCIWILPQPRYYACEVKLAPEMSGDNVGGGLSSIASSFGFDLNAMAVQDAIYPELYPDLFESPEFIVGLYDIQVKTIDGKISTTYYDYIKSYQKTNILTFPFRWALKSVKGWFEEDDSVNGRTETGEVNPFLMSKKDYTLLMLIMKKVSCSVDKKNSVITIKVEDQDPLVCAIMADSVKLHLQNFIVRYRTSKANEDLIHYQQVRDSAELEYDQIREAYSRYCDTHQDVYLQSYLSKRDKLEGQLTNKQNSLTAMETQLQATKVKLQEKTPAFTTLKSAIVPIKPAGPKRMIFVLAMMFLSTLVYSIVVCRHYLMKFL